MENKVVFITGVSRGIGRSLFNESNEQGSRTYGIGRSNPNNISLFLNLDMKNPKDLESFNFPELDDEVDEIWLINNAGIIGEISHIESQTYSQISEVLQVNLLSVIYLTNLFLKAYKGTSALKVVHISSGAAHSAIPSWASYCTSKAGLEMHGAVLQKECDESGDNVKVFSIAPGVVDTQMQAEIRSSKDEDFSSKPKFVDLKNNGELVDSDKAAKTLLNLLENQTIPGSYTLRDYY